MAIITYQSQRCPVADWNRRYLALPSCWSQWQHGGRSKLLLSVTAPVLSSVKKVKKKIIKIDGMFDVNLIKGI